jgi:hypothetical protein
MDTLLDASINTRKIAADCFESALRQVLNSSAPVSEVDLRDLWLRKLREHNTICPDGWYTPPPHGMFVQFGTDTNPERVCQESNRVPEAWPRADIFLDRTCGIISAYASPVDKETGMIGDFGITLYLGNNPDIQSLVKQTLEIDIALFDTLKAGMEYAAIPKMSAKLMADRNLYNSILAINDPAGTNIGHTFPASDTGWSKSELDILSSGDWVKAAALISKRRMYLSTAETTPISPNIIHTIEPRPMVSDRPDLPMISLHTIVVWRNGKKQLITNFDKLFQLAGMDYMPLRSE